MGKIVKTFVYIATSPDGFIARKNGDLDWLPSDHEGENGESGDEAEQSCLGID